jgi:hypothetical protein
MTDAIPENSTHRTLCRVPLPIVLIIGDESDRRTGEFATSVWEGACETHERETSRMAAADRTPPIKLTHDLVTQIGRLESPFAWAHRRVDRVPTPVFLQDNGDASSQEFHRSLVSVFANTQVWGVIAAGNAENTEFVRSIIGPVDLPLLTTTDTTTYTRGSGANPNELRLIPTNDVQADSIISNCIENGQAAAASREVGLLTDSGPNTATYVNDLSRALEDAARRRTIHLVPDRRAITKEMQVIVVGYVEFALELLAQPQLPRGARFVCSDGCYGLPLSERIMELDQDATNWFWTRPDVKFDNIGGSALAAIIDAGSSLREMRRQGDRGIRKRSFIELVKENLEKGQDFGFIGGRNTKLRYVIEPIGEVSSI